MIIYLLFIFKKYLHCLCLSDDLFFTYINGSSIFISPCTLSLIFIDCILSLTDTKAQLIFKKVLDLLEFCLTPS